VARNGPYGEDRLWCAIPVYNNGDTLRGVVEGCLAVLRNVVVVDDGSTDADVPALLTGLDVTLIRHEENLGKGAAILNALGYVSSQGGLYMVTVDADGQHDPEDLGKFIPLMMGGEDSLIVGCRDFNTENVPERSRFGRKFANFWLRVETGVRLDDCQSGFRAYPVRHMSGMTFLGTRYDFEAEVLTRLAWAGVKIKSVDIGVRYPPSDERVSHFRPFMDNLRISLMHTRLVVRRLQPIPHKRLVPREKPDLKVLLHPVKALSALIREHSTPGGLAAAAAVGILLATLPLIFLHTVVILYVATRLNLNKVVAVNVQHICMPPFVPAICIEVGYFMRNGRWLTDISFTTVFEQFADRLLEWLLGSLVVAPIGAALAGALVYLTASVLARRRVMDA
jgi:uncharacterized protein (DUF2062 family)